MNKKLRFTGGEPDITEDNLLRDSDALYEFTHEFGKAVSGDTDYILQGCVFSKVTGTGSDSGTITAGYVFDSTSGEVVKVDAQTAVPETLGTDLWELQLDTTTFEAAGDKTYEDGTPRQTYQKKRMILTNVASVTNFDIEHTDSYDAWREIPNGDITFEAEWSDGTYTNLKYRRRGNLVDFLGYVDADTSGAWVPNTNWEIQIPKADYFDVEPTDTLNSTTASVGWYRENSASIQEPCRVSFSDTDATNLRILFLRSSGNTFAASKTHFFSINATIEIK